ncbi:MAG: hypothetical protein ABS79_07920 [Planctomycetes bacterium SCN 63-9]|nr:MAG: hypothetical protein ABS79_07920 [Planctomycetes bacterium SCN 63-9]
MPPVDREHPASSSDDPGNAPLTFKALRILNHGWGAGWSLRPSPSRRSWMDENPQAYKCLPIVAANQWGWQILCPVDVRATWDGSPDPAGLTVEVAASHRPAIKSQFGSGILTFSPPWLFRTSAGWDLYVKGPSNRWKANCMPLEGIVETWWLNYTFTLNWKIVEPGTVSFSQGESLAQLVPVPHQTFANAVAQETPIVHAEPEAARELMEWRANRREIANQPVNTHQRYRKAEGIEGHLRTVDVPEVRWTTGSEEHGAGDASGETPPS